MINNLDLTNIKPNLRKEDSYLIKFNFSLKKGGENNF